MRPVQLLFDENVPLALLRAMKRQSPGTTIVRVGDDGAPPFGTRDPELLSWGEEEQFLLVSCDRASLPVHFGDHLASGRHSYGVILLRPSGSIPAYVLSLLLVTGASWAEDWLDTIDRVPFQEQ